MSVSSRSPLVFSVRSEHKVARDNDISFVSVRNTGFQILQEVSGSWGSWAGWQGAGWEAGELGVGPTATLTGAGSQAGNSLMAKVSKIPSRKRRKTRERQQERTRGRKPPPPAKKKLRWWCRQEGPGRRRETIGGGNVECMHISMLARSAGKASSTTP